MLKLSATILLLAMSLQSFNLSIINFRFYLERSYISNNLCVNRYRPSLHCNGKCILAKKLKQEEKNRDQAPERKPVSQVDIGYLAMIQPLPAPELTLLRQPYRPLQTSEVTDRSAAVFHPPKC